MGVRLLPWPRAGEDAPVGPLWPVVPPWIARYGITTNHIRQGIQAFALVAVTMSIFGIPNIYEYLAISAFFQPGLVLLFGGILLVARNFGPIPTPAISFQMMLGASFSCAESLAIQYIVLGIMGGDRRPSAKKAVLTGIFCTPSLVIHNAYQASDRSRKLLGLLANIVLGLSILGSYRIEHGPMWIIERHLLIYISCGAVLALGVCVVVLPTSTGDTARLAFAGGLRGVGGVFSQAVDFVTGPCDGTGRLAGAFDSPDASLDPSIVRASIEVAPGLMARVIGIHQASMAVGQAILGGAMFSAAARVDLDIWRRTFIFPVASGIKLGAVLDDTLTSCMSAVYLTQDGRAKVHLCAERREAFQAVASSVSSALGAAAACLAANAPIAPGLAHLESAVSRAEELVHEIAQLPGDSALDLDRLALRMITSSVVRVVERTRACYRCLPGVLALEQPSSAELVREAMEGFPRWRVLRLQHLLDPSPPATLRRGERAVARSAHVDGDEEDGDEEDGGDDDGNDDGVGDEDDSAGDGSGKGAGAGAGARPPAGAPGGPARKAEKAGDPGATTLLASAAAQLKETVETVTIGEGMTIRLGGSEPNLARCDPARKERAAGAGGAIPRASSDVELGLHPPARARAESFRGDPGGLEEAGGTGSTQSTLRRGRADAELIARVLDYAEGGEATGEGREAGRMLRESFMPIASPRARGGPGREASGRLVGEASGAASPRSAEPPQGEPAGPGRGEDGAPFWDRRARAARATLHALSRASFMQVELPAPLSRRHTGEGLGSPRDVASPRGATSPRGIGSFISFRRGLSFALSGGADGQGSGRGRERLASSPDPGRSGKGRGASVGRTADGDGDPEKLSHGGSWGPEDAPPPGGDPAPGAAVRAGPPPACHAPHRFGTNAAASGSGGVWAAVVRAPKYDPGKDATRLRTWMNELNAWLGKHTFFTPMGLKGGVQLSLSFYFVLALEAVNRVYNGLYQKPVWAILAVMVMTEGSSGASLRKGFFRIVGTILGGLAGLATVYIAYGANGASYDNHPTKFVMIALFLAIFESLTTILSALIKEHSYIYFTAHLTLVSVSLVGYLDTVPMWRYSLWRSLLTLIGVVTFACAAILVLPNRSADEVRRAVAVAIDSLSSATRTLSSFYDGSEEADPKAAGAVPPPAAAASVEPSAPPAAPPPSDAGPVPAPAAAPAAVAGPPTVPSRDEPAPDAALFRASSNSFAQRGFADLAGLVRGHGAGELEPDGRAGAETDAEVGLPAAVGEVPAPTPAPLPAPAKASISRALLKLSLAGRPAATLVDRPGGSDGGGSAAGSLARGGPASGGPPDPRRSIAPAADRLYCSDLYRPGTTWRQFASLAFKQMLSKPGPQLLSPEDRLFGPATVAVLGKVGPARMSLSMASLLISSLKYEVMPWDRFTRPGRHAMTEREAFLLLRVARHGASLLITLSHDLDSHSVRHVALPEELAAMAGAAFAQAAEALAALGAFARREADIADVVRCILASSRLALLFGAASVLYSDEPDAAVRYDEASGNVAGAPPGGDLIPDSAVVAAAPPAAPASRSSGSTSSSGESKGAGARATLTGPAAGGWRPGDTAPHTGAAPPAEPVLPALHHSRGATLEHWDLARVSALAMFHLNNAARARSLAGVLTVAMYGPDSPEAAVVASSLRDAEAERLADDLRVRVETAPARLEKLRQRARKRRAEWRRRAKGLVDIAKGSLAAGAAGAAATAAAESPDGKGDPADGGEGRQDR